MKPIKKLMILATCLLVAGLSFAKATGTAASQPALSSVPAAAPAATTSSTVKPMATSLANTSNYATNTATVNAAVIFYNSSMTALTSWTNVGAKSQIYFPVEASFISIKSGPTYASIKTATNYLLMYSNSAWTFTAV